MITNSEQNTEIIDQLHGRDGDTVVAEWRRVGSLAVYTELTTEVDELLKLDSVHNLPRGSEFYSYRSLAISAMEFQDNPGFGRLARTFGFSHDSRPLRTSTIPTASYLNEKLDEIAPHATRFRFYEPSEKQGLSSGPEYIQKLAEGFVPLASLRDISWYAHDVVSHAMGYVLIDSKTTNAIRAHAQFLVSKGMDPELPLDANSASFAATVDSLSSTMNRPLYYGNKALKRKRVMREAGSLPLRSFGAEFKNVGIVESRLITKRLLQSQKELGIS